MKYTIKTEAPALISIFITWILGVYFYAQFPEKVITHWNFNGVADGYSGKTLGAFLMPIISTFFYVLFLALPSLDPKKENYLKFENLYHWLKNIFIIFMLLISTVVGAVNLGINIPINLIVPSLVGLMFIALGSIIGKIKQNWFIGFRFPWTLTSESVWNKTNRFGGWSMIFCGGLMLLTPLLPNATGMAIFYIAILQMVFGTMIYSYLVYRKEQKSGQNKI
ncbi:MAG: SdpI family protein [Patescibacteria group bacterium]|jgi:uncharacterized membrane protein